MDLFNLNHTQYSNKDIEEILSITYPYQREDIISQKAIILNKMTSDSSLDISSKQKIGKFLDDISDRLISIISKGISLSDKKDDTIETFEKRQNYVKEVNGHFIIKNEDREREAYTLSSADGLNLGNDSGAPPGIINPIKHTTIKRAVNIDSRFRPNYYNTSSSDQHLTLPYKFDNVLNMRLASIELPLTFHTISGVNGNNVFLVNWDSSGNDWNNSMRVLIPDGNYDTNINNTGVTNIETAINAALNNPDNKKMKPSSNTIASDPNFNMIFTVDLTSGRSIFSADSSNNPTNTDFEIIWAVNSSGDPTVNVNLSFYLGWMLGYRVNIYTSGKPSPGNYPTSFVSEGICYLKGPSYIFVAIDDYNNNVNNYYISAYSSSINSNNILARINLASIKQSNGSYQTGEDDGFSTQVNRSRNYFGPVDIEKLRITLYDEYGRVVNLNNMDWSCALMFECMYTS